MQVQDAEKFLTSSYDLLDQVMKTNFYSPLTLTKNFLKYSKSKKKYSDDYINCR